MRGWGSYPEGKKLGSLHGDMAADSKGNVYTTDANNHRIQVFNSAGVHQLTIGGPTLAASRVRPP